MKIIKSIKNYFRKRKERKDYINRRTLYFKIMQRECPHLYVSITSEIEYCCYKRPFSNVTCNPYRCSLMLAKMAEFDKEWEKKSNTN